MSEENTPPACGVGIRGVAMAIDSVVWFGLLFVAGFSVALLTGDVQTTGGTTNANLEGGPAQAAFALWLGLSIGYHTILEWRFGKTIGKYLVGIRATNDDGSPLTVRSSLVRNLFRLVDFFPFFYVVGIVTGLLSDRRKRIGDRVGDTVVVRS